jgi:uncharacterized protein
VGKKLLRIEEKAIREQAEPIAIKMLECALSQGVGEAGYQLGIHYDVDGKLQSAMRAYQDGAKLGNRLCLSSLEELFQKGQLEQDIAPDAQRAACYKRLWREVEKDISKRYPDLDRICPLPPKPMPNR